LPREVGCLEGTIRHSSGFQPANLIKTPARRMYLVPEGQHDRSHSTSYRLLMAGLARSAWDSATQKSRPVGYGLIHAGVRTNSTMGNDKISNTTNGAHLRREIRSGMLGKQCPIIPYPTGRFSRWTFSQALRARPAMSKRQRVEWLRSCCPSGTKYILSANAFD
jgi:hypothetical protein